MLSFLAVLGTALALPPEPTFQQVPQPMERALSEVCFPSGLRVTVREDHREPVVSFSARVDRGADADPAGREGAAHLMQHLWFDARPAGGPSVSDRLQAVGARWNATVEPDASVYVTAAPASAWQELVRLEVDRLIDPLAGITDADLKAAQQRVQTELTDPATLPFHDLPRYMPDGFFPDGIARDDAPTTRASVAAVGMADVRTVARSYAPTTLNLYLTGDLDSKAVLKFVQDVLPEKLLFELPDGTRPEAGTCEAKKRPAIMVPPKRDKKAPITGVVGPVATPTLVVGWSLPPSYGEVEGTMDLAAFFQTRRMIYEFIDESGTLFQRIAPRCEVVPGVGGSAFLCTLQIPPGTEPKKLKDTFLASMTRTDWTEDDENHHVTVERVQHVISTSIAIGEYQTLQGDDLLYDIESNHVHGHPLWYMETLNALNSTDHVLIREFIATWLNSDQAMARVLVPEGTTPDAVVAATGKLPVFERGGKRLLLPSRVVADDTPLHLEARSSLAGVSAPAAPAAPRFGDIADVTLPNGVRVVAVHYGDMPIVRAMVLGRGGASNEPKRGLGTWAWDMLRYIKPDNLPNYTQVAAAIGSQWGIEDQGDGQALTLRGTAGNVDGMLWLLRALTTGTRAVESGGVRREVRLVAEDMLAWLATAPDDQARRARLDHVLGATHPLAMSRWDHMIAGSNLPYTTLQAEIERIWAPTNITVAIVGGIDPKEAVATATTMFGDYTRHAPEPTPAEPLPAKPTAPATTLAFPDPGALTARIGLSCAPTSDTPEAVRTVGAELLRQVAWSTVSANDDAATPPTVDVPVWGPDTVIDLHATLSPGQSTAVGKALLDAVERLATQGPTPDELRSAAAFSAQAHILAYADADRVVDAAVRLGKDLPAHAAAEGKALAAVTGAAITAWLAPCAGHEAVTVVGPAATPIALTP